MRMQPRRAKIALIAGFGAVVLAARLYAFFVDSPGIAGTVATIAAFAMLIAGVIALYIGLKSMDWTKLRRKRKRYRP